MSEPTVARRGNESTVSRRGLLRAGGVAAVGTAAVATGTASAQSDYDGWLDNTGNYDGSATDATGQDSVTIEVGADGNSGPFAFAPAAVTVTPGTTITWEWVNGTHDVVDDGGAFESERSGEAGHTFEYTPEETGLFKYYCTPHETMGMKGVVEVVEGGTADSGGGGQTSGDATDAMGSTGDGGVGGLVVSALALAFLSPAIFATFLRNRDGQERGDGKST